MRQYLNKKKIGAVAKNNRRRLLVALFNFAKAHGWLSKSETTAADGLGAYKVKEKDVQVFTPDEVTRLTEHAGADFLPWVAIIAFGGVRHEELSKGLTWSCINFQKGTIIAEGNLQELHRRMGHAIVAHCGADVLVACGRYSSEMTAAAEAAGMSPRRVLRCQAVEEAATRLQDLVGPGCVVLVKGGRGLGLTRLVEVLLDEAPALTA